MATRSAPRRPVAAFRSRKRSKTTATRHVSTKASESEGEDSDGSVEIVSDSSSGTSEVVERASGSRSRRGTRHRSSSQLAKLSLRNARSRSATTAGTGTRRGSLPRRGPPSARSSKSASQRTQLGPPTNERELRRAKALSPLPVNHAVDRRTRTGKAIQPVAATRRSGSRSTSTRAASSSTHRRTSREENSRGLKRKRGGKEESEMEISEEEDDVDEDEDEDDEAEASDEEMDDNDETDDHYIFFATLNELHRQRRSELAKLYCLIRSTPLSQVSSSLTKDDLINTILRHRASHPAPSRDTSATEGSDADSPRPYTSHEGSPADSPRATRRTKGKAGGTKKRGDRRRAHVPTPPPSDQESELTEEEDEEEVVRKPARGRSKSLADVPRPKAALVGRKSAPNVPMRREARTRAGMAKAGIEASRQLRNGKSVVVRAFKPKSVKFSPAEEDEDEEQTEHPASDEEEDEVDASEEEVASTLMQRRGSQASGTSSPGRAIRAAKAKAVANIGKRSPKGKRRMMSPTTSDVAGVSDPEEDIAEAADEKDEAEASSDLSSEGQMDIATPLRAPRKQRNGRVAEIDLTGDDDEDDEDEQMAEATESEDELAHATEGTLARLKKDDLVRLCEEHGLEADGTKKDLATALLQWRDNDFDHSSNDSGGSSSHSTLSAGSTETVHAETKTQALHAAASARNRRGKAPLLMIDGHSSSPEKPRTAHVSKKNEEEEVDALDLESLQLQDKEIQPEKLVKLEKVGSGGFKDVYKGTYRRKTIAIADIRGHLTEMDIKELGLLRDLRHPNIVHFIGVSIPKAPSTVPVMIVTELCANGDLFDYLRGVQAPAFSQMLDIMLGIASGVEYLHNSKPAIIHRDIKSSNVLITAQGKAKINDFGLARVKTSTKSVIRSLVGTVNWQAPELWVPHPRYNEKVDVYSVGLVYWEMLQWHQPVKRYPFEGLNEHAIYESAGQKRQRPSTASMGRQWGRDILELVEAMWHWDPAQRPSMSRVRIELEVQLDVERRKERDGEPTRARR